MSDTPTTDDRPTGGDTASTSTPDSSRVDDNKPTDGVDITVAPPLAVGDPEQAPSEDTRPRSPVRTIGRWLGRAMLVLLVIIVAMATWPVSTGGLGARSEPTSSYEESVELFNEITADEPDFVFEPCQSQMMLHGQPTDVVVVLFHGLTNCPEQYLDFGKSLFDEGANVVILRAPGHGHANAGGDAIGSVSNAGGVDARELRDYADDAIDIATGLGDEVRVTGLSMGGVIASWVAQFRDDVDRVVVVAPALNIPGTPSVATSAFLNLFSRVPNIDLPGRSKLDHAYAGETSRGLAAMFRLARATQDSTHHRGPAASEVIVVINPDDDQVDQDEVQGFATRWAEQDGRVSIEFLPATGLPHDVIDEAQPAGDVATVYPILFDLLANGST